tara:strand:- start:1160 stop:1462 length:303 start_codon:yes stop_codon:yes gene_type:complete
MVPNTFATDEDIQNELKEVIFDECTQAVIRSFACTCMVSEGNVFGFKEWKVTIPLHSAEAVYHRIALWAEEWLHREEASGRLGIDSIMLEKEFVKKVYLR